MPRATNARVAELEAEVETANMKVSMYSALIREKDGRIEALVNLVNLLGMAKPAPVPQVAPAPGDVPPPPAENPPA